MDRKKRVIVGLSGGVDSAVTAALLKEQGYHVCGVTMRICDDSVAAGTSRHGCYGPGEREDIEDALRVCQTLKIPFQIFDLKREYEEKVLECHHGGVMLLDGNIYGSNSRGWVCLDVATGTVKYQDKLVGKGSGIYVDGLFYLYGEGGGFALVKATPAGFETVSSFKITLGDDKHWPHPVVSNGVLYVRHGNTLMAYDVKAK